MPKWTIEFWLSRRCNCPGAEAATAADATELMEAAGLSPSAAFACQASKCVRLCGRRRDGGLDLNGDASMRRAWRQRQRAGQDGRAITEKHPAGGERVGEVGEVVSVGDVD